MDMTVEWDVTKRLTAVVSVPEDSTPEQRHTIALRATREMTPADSQRIRGTASWNTPDGQFGGIIV
jgi:hypothetical protein